VPGLSQKPFLRMPLATPNLNAGMGFLQGNGVREGNDFRGVPVLAATRLVTGLPWDVVAKTDVSEVMRPLDQRRHRIGWIFGSVILMSIVLVFSVWRGQRIALASALRQYESERDAMIRNAGTLMQHARDAILLVAEDGRIVEANAAAEALYGYSSGELRKLTIRDLRPDADQSAFDHQWAAAATEQGTLFEAVHRRKDGSLVNVEVSSRVIEVEGHAYRESSIRDIGHRKALERQVERLLRVQRALQVATGVLMRSTSEDELYQRMSGVVVDVAGYRLGYVALADDDADKSIRIVATAGHGTDIFSYVRLNWREGNTSMTGSAVRTGQIQVNQDFTTNPNVAGWRDEALKRDFLSSIALPIRDGSRVIGVFGLISSERDAFDAQEVGVLATLADDISYGVAALRARNRGDGD
jgi:PAS domain S-box-containing protein